MASTSRPQPPALTRQVSVTTMVQPHTSSLNLTKEQLIGIIQRQQYTVFFIISDILFLCLDHFIVECANTLFLQILLFLYAYAFPVESDSRGGPPSLYDLPLRSQYLGLSFFFFFFFSF